MAAYFGLTSRRWQSGKSIDVQGRDQQGRRPGRAAGAVRGGIRADDALQAQGQVKTWGLAVAKRRCHRKATVAVARKLAVVMHAMWVDGTFYSAIRRRAPLM